MKKYAVIFSLFLFPLFLFAANAAPGAGVVVPNVDINLNGGNDPTAVVSSIKIILLLTILAVAPAILLTMTSFTRILVVLSLLKQAMGTQQAPAAQILVSLSLTMSVFIMLPVFKEINETGLKPYMDGEIGQEAFFENSTKPLKKFMLKHTREKDLALFVNLSENKKPQNADEISFFTVVPSFVISELKTAFQMGFMIYLPFFLLDLVVASILMSMGMMMLPPVIISLPIKLMIFVLADGWNLVIGSLLKSFKMG